MFYIWKISSPPLTHHHHHSLSKIHKCNVLFPIFHNGHPHLSHLPLLSLWRQILIVGLRCRRRLESIELSSFPKCSAMESHVTTISSALTSKGSVIFSRACKRQCYDQVTKCLQRTDICSVCLPPSP